MRNRKEFTFKDIENSPEYKATKHKICDAIVADLPLSSEPEAVEATADAIVERMRQLFAIAFPDVKFDAVAEARIAEAEKKARDILRKSVFPGLYQ